LPDLAEAQRQAEHLFQTLLHRAFRGELRITNDRRRLESLKPLKGAEAAEGWRLQRIQRNSAHSAIPRRGPLVAVGWNR
jgi:hypothetical protein